MVVERNPVLTRRTRGGALESLHRGCWAVVDTDGAVLASAGDPDQSIFPRSASKSLQALGPLRSGAVETHGLGAEHLAVMISSHNGEPIHEQTVGSLLERIGLAEGALRCGPAAPTDDPHATPRRIRHNCSGKHAGFLAGAVALGQDPTTYIDPQGAIQVSIQEAVSEMAGLDPGTWQLAVDGCSAPTFIMSLKALALGIARVASPRDLDPDLASRCEMLTGAAAAHPNLVAGSSPPRFDTALIGSSQGRLFAKGGADGVQVIGVREAGIAFAGKVDDGNPRGLLPVAISVLESMGHVSDDEIASVQDWIDPVIRNADGLEVGTSEVAPTRSAS